MKNTKKQKAFLFDIDGTLTESRMSMSTDSTMAFLSWMIDKDIFLVTGSDIEKAKQQIPQSILSRCIGIFSSMGNVYHVNDDLVYENRFNIDDDILCEINKMLCSSQCPEEYRATKHYEYRPGMLNFSFCGRDVTRQQRKQYNKWDIKHGERIRFVEWFNKRFASENLEACLGGEISIDIQPVGKDKRQAVKYLVNHGYNEFVFFGDRAIPGGNDWGVCEYIIENNLGTYYSVDSPKETVALLSTII